MCCNCFAVFTSLHSKSQQGSCYTNRVHETRDMQPSSAGHLLCFQVVMPAPQHLQLHLHLQLASASAWHALCMLSSAVTWILWANCPGKSYLHTSSLYMLHQSIWFLDAFQYFINDNCRQCGNAAATAEQHIHCECSAAATAGAGSGTPSP